MEKFHMVNQAGVVLEPPRFHEFFELCLLLWPCQDVILLEM